MRLFLAAAGDSSNAVIVSLIGVMTTLVTALAGALGYLIKSMSNRIDKKDEELSKARVEVTEALTKSSDVLVRAIEFMDGQVKKEEQRTVAARKRAG